MNVLIIEEIKKEFKLTVIDEFLINKSDSGLLKTYVIDNFLPKSDDFELIVKELHSNDKKSDTIRVLLCPIGFSRNGKDYQLENIELFQTNDIKVFNKFISILS